VRAGSSSLLKYKELQKQEQEQEQEQRRRDEPRLFRSARDIRIAAASQPTRYWPVPGLIAPGLSLLFAAPKMGKTRLLVDIGWNVAAGSPALGALTTHQGDVLLVLSETTAAALDDVWQETFPDVAEPPDRLSVVSLEDWRTAIGTYTSKPLGHLAESWRTSVERPVLMVVDNLSTCVMPYVDGRVGENVTERDRRMQMDLHQWAHRHGIAVMMVHHDNKTKLEKGTAWETAAAGSRGITAVPDDLFMLYRTDADGGGLGLKYKGRSLGRDRDWTLLWRGGRIHMFDPVDVTDRLGGQMRSVMEALIGSVGESSPSEIAERCDIPENTVRQYLIRLRQKNLVARVGRGRYRVVDGAFGQPDE
jgi:hypothetical protein